MLYEKDGFVVDLNGISRDEHRQWRIERRDIDELDRDMFDVQVVYLKVIKEWPFKAPITMKGYLSLGFGDSIAVDRVVSDAVEELNKKK